MRSPLRNGLQDEHTIAAHWPGILYIDIRKSLILSISTFFPCATIIALLGMIILWWICLWTPILRAYIDALPSTRQWPVEDGHLPDPCICQKERVREVVSNRHGCLHLLQGGSEMQKKLSMHAMSDHRYQRTNNRKPRVFAIIPAMHTSIYLPCSSFGERCRQRHRAYDEPQLQPKPAAPTRWKASAYVREGTGPLTPRQAIDPSSRCEAVPCGGAARQNLSVDSFFLGAQCSSAHANARAKIEQVHTSRPADESDAVSTIESFQARHCLPAFNEESYTWLDRLTALVL